MPIVVLGATGAIGGGVVQAAVDRGRPVVAIARDAEALADLRARHPRAAITVLPGSVASDAEGAALAERLRQLGRPLAGVVACLCGQASGGRLIDQPADALRRRLDEDLLPHLAAARHLLPLLAETGRNATYVLVGGPGSEHPWAGYGHRSIGAAAVKMLARVLHDEARMQAVRVQLLTVDRPVCTDARRQQLCPQWPSALAVGQRALALIERSADVRAAPSVVHYPGTDATSLDEGLTSSKLEVVSSPGSEGAPDGVESAPTQSSNPQKGPATPPAGHASQACPAGAVGLLPEGCQQSARKLLRSLLSPQSPSIQDKDTSS
jgi:NADP-dependent 3-hydroxy acid dehydrogenase YdfG